MAECPNGGRSLPLGPVILAVSLALAASGCADVRPIAKVDPTVIRPSAAASDRRPAEQRLRVAFAAMTSPQATATTYDALVAYVERRLGSPVHAVRRRTFGEISELLAQGAVDVAFVCSLPYVIGHGEFGLELLVAPESGSGPVFYSELIVPASSSAKSLADLRGGVFAFTDRISNTGHLVPVYELWRKNEVPESFFGRTLFTYGHDNSIRAVADGLVDGAAVSSGVYERLTAAEPSLRRETRVVQRWGPFATSPVVVRPTLAAETKAVLSEIFLTMHRDEEGAGILRDLRYERFVEVDDTAYDGIREMWLALGRSL